MPYPADHRAEVKGRIVSSARRLFNKHGFDNVSLDQIMAGAGLTRGGFYSYFESKSDIYAEIVQLAREGKAILMVSSYLPELLGVCDRIAVMSRGRLSAARPTEEWTADSIMEAAIGTPDAA